jgi:transcriptional regulator with XRE-family HTH domain
MVWTSLHIMNGRRRHQKEWQMYSNPQKLSSGEVTELRKEAGRWLKELREARGLSQRNLADKVGAEYYTFISQLEAGRGRIPPDRYLAWAHALEIEPRFFVRSLLRFYDPVTYSILYGEEVAADGPSSSSSVIELKR